MKFLWLGTVCAMFCLPVAVLAQGPGASVTGDVRDPSGAIIATAKVAVRNTATNVTRSTVTDAAGIFVISNLQPGSYEVTVESPGFNKDVRSGLVLEVAEVARVDFALKLGSA